MSAPSGGVPSGVPSGRGGAPMPPPQRSKEGSKLGGISELGPAFPGEAHLGEACELVPGRLFFAPLKPKKLEYVLAQSSRATGGLGYVAFCVDKELVYEPYEQDFGPLNLACVFRFCSTLDLLLQHPGSQMRPVYFCCSNDPAKKANAAVLIGTFLVLRYHFLVEEAASLLSSVGRYMPFRDASKGGFDYFITVQHCLQGMARAASLGWLDSKEFRLKEYERLDRADLSWMVPGKILAFSTPSRDAKGPGCVTPEDYVPYFKQVGVKAIVRLNKKVYERWRFTVHGFGFHDLSFADGRPPPEEVRTKFLKVAEGVQGPVAVHCRAGLGRTGVLVGCYLMKHFRFSANEAIGYMRIIRPGSVIGQQQLYLAYMEGKLWSEGESFQMIQASRLVGSVVHPEESGAAGGATEDASSLEADSDSSSVQTARKIRRTASALLSKARKQAPSGAVSVRRVTVDSEESAAAAVAEIQFAKHEGSSGTPTKHRRSDSHSSSSSSHLSDFNRRSQGRIQEWLGSRRLPGAPSQTWSAGSKTGTEEPGSKTETGEQGSKTETESPGSRQDGKTHSKKARRGGSGYLSDDGVENVSDASSVGSVSRVRRTKTGTKEAAHSEDEVVKPLRAKTRGKDKRQSKGPTKVPRCGSAEWADCKQQMELNLLASSGEDESPKVKVRRKRAKDGSPMHRRPEAVLSSLPKAEPILEGISAEAAAGPSEGAGTQGGRTPQFDVQVRASGNAGDSRPLQAAEDPLELAGEDKNRIGDAAEGLDARPLDLKGEAAGSMTPADTAALVLGNRSAGPSDPGASGRSRTGDDKAGLKAESKEGMAPSAAEPRDAGEALKLERQSTSRSDKHSKQKGAPSKGKSPSKRSLGHQEPKPGDGSQHRASSGLLQRLIGAVHWSRGLKPESTGVEKASQEVPARPAAPLRKVVAVEGGRFRIAARTWSSLKDDST